MQAPYIPAKDADFNAWLLNCAVLATASPTTYGLTAPIAVIMTAQSDAVQAAFALKNDPSTRTPVTVNAYQTARAVATGTMRPYCMSVKINPAVNDDDKIAFGVNPPNVAPTPVPPIITSPALILVAATPGQHQLQYRDATTPNSKAKPFGAIGLEVWRAIGTVAAVDPEQAKYYQNWSKSPNTSNFSPTDESKKCTYFARWVTRSGPGGTATTGPWSAPLTVTII